MGELIRWYRNLPPRLRVVFRTDSNGHHDPVESAPRPPKRRIVVVCFGNVCRSPVAAALLQARLGDEWDVASVGTNAVDGKPATDLMWTAAIEHGVDLSTHRARRLTVDDVRDAELIVAMSKRQALKIRQLDPAVTRRIQLLGGFSPQPNAWGLPADPDKPAAGQDEIPDPIGEDLEFHRECCRRLSESADRLTRCGNRGRPTAAFRSRPS